nr:MAG TPA: hypothetical protein [Caudoviricetes sp.]DAW90481.1 MAG TPA: hypothetical protein [Caudoviricetes sp.]
MYYKDLIYLERGRVISLSLEIEATLVENDIVTRGCLPKSSALR